MGIRPTRGVLLYGPPGTGKTYIARAMANECKVSFIYANGSEFVELYVGVGAKRIRDLFKEARRKKPCIIFLDEIDALGGARSVHGTTGGQKETDITLNQVCIYTIYIATKRNGWIYELSRSDGNCSHK